MDTMAAAVMPEEKKKIEDLRDTTDLMFSNDYKKRFVAEYWQTKIRYEKLKKFNTRIEAANRAMEPDYMGVRRSEKSVDMPKHDCPESMLRAQQAAMGEYLHILEMRAVIEGIELEQ